MKSAYDPEYFSDIAAIIIGGEELEAENICGEMLGMEGNCRNVLLFSEMIKAGWSLPKEHYFLYKDWKTIWLTRISFCVEKEKLPAWNGLFKDRAGGAA